MNKRRWFSILTVLLAALTMLLLSFGFTWAQESEQSREPGESDIVVQPAEPDGRLARVAAGSYDFLAIGVPYEDIDTNDDAGAVNVIYDSGTGLSADGNQIWYEDYNGMLGADEEDNLFGDALAVGDFDGDGFGCRQL